MGTDARMLAYTHRIAQSCDVIAVAQERQALVAEATYLRSLLAEEPGVAHTSKRARLKAIDAVLFEEQ